jgi:hypothetical protein
MPALGLLLCLLSQDIPVCTASGDQLLPVATSVSGQYYLFWEDRRYVPVDSSYAIFGGRVSASGTVIDPDGRRLFKSQTRYDLSSASDGLGLFVAFEDSC